MFFYHFSEVNRAMPNFWLKILVGGTIIVIFFMLIYSHSRNFHANIWTPNISNSPVLGLYNVIHTVTDTKVATSTSALLFNHNFTTVTQQAGGTDCEVPLAGFKGWNNRVVTALTPVIKRNCAKLFAGDQEEIKKIKGKSLTWNNDLTDRELLKMTGNCTWVRDYFHGNLYTTKLERSFPIAYSFVIYNSPQQVLRLFKYLYKPTNVYCIHPDKKSDQMVELFRNLVVCLENVIMPSNLMKVSWGHFSLLEAQLSCLTALVQWRLRQPEHKKWKYVINLCGKELPLVSTHTIAMSLSKLNGTSSIIARHATDSGTRSRLKGKKVPHNFLYYKSMTYVALSYKFAYFLLNNSTAIELHEFFMKCGIPEEHFYATVYMIPGVPGGFNPKMKDLYFRVSMYIWLTSRNHSPCVGKNVHSICVVTVGDLKLVLDKKRRSLFHNKYFMEQDHTIMDCMEESLVVQNMKEFQDDC